MRYLLILSLFLISCEEGDDRLCCMPYETQTTLTINNQNDVISIREVSLVGYEFEDIKKFDREQEWPIHFSLKMRPDCMRILFEHGNGELYQLDVPNSVYKKLKLVLKDQERVSLQ